MTVAKMLYQGTIGWNPRPLLLWTNLWRVGPVHTASLLLSEDKSVFKTAPVEPNVTSLAVCNSLAMSCMCAALLGTSLPPSLPAGLSAYLSTPPSTPPPTPASAERDWPQVASPIGQADSHLITAAGLTPGHVWQPVHACENLEESVFSSRFSHPRLNELIVPN